VPVYIRNLLERTDDIRNLPIVVRLIPSVACDSCARILIPDNLQIISDLPKSGVNTSPPVSEYEDIMFRNSVNLMSQFAQSLHGLETSASLTLLFHSRCLPSSSLPEFSFFIADDPLHDVHHNFKANLRDKSTPLLLLNNLGFLKDF